MFNIYIDEWPIVLKQIQQHSCIMSAFGGLVHYLRRLKLEASLLSYQKFTIISPYDATNNEGGLILDGQTLTNLEILESSSFSSGHLNTGKEEGSLFSVLNHTLTSFGKRKLKKWICHPLRNIEAIQERLDAIEFLYVQDALRGKFFLKYNFFKYYKY